MGRGSGVIPDVDASLQPWVDGDYNGGHFKVYEAASGWPHPESDTLLIDETIPTPAVASVVSSTDLRLTNINGATVLANSAADKKKYAIRTKSDNTGAKMASVGTAGSIAGGGDPDIVVATMDWFGDGTSGSDHIDFDSMHMKAVAAPDHYAVTVSDTVPIEGTGYTATAQPQDASNVDIRRIGITLTPSVVGSTPGSISESSVVTDQDGVSETMHATAGTTAGNAEHVHVTDGTVTGDSADVTPIATNPTLSFALLDTGLPSTTGSYTRTGITVSAGNWLLALTANATTDGANVPTATGLTFTHIFSQQGPTSGITHDYYVAPCPSGFSGSVAFSAPGGGNARYSVLLEVTPSATVSSITTVTANDSQAERWTGTEGTTEDVSFTQPSFSDPNNAGVAFALAFNWVTTSSPRTGWTKQADFQIAATTATIAVITRSGTDTKGTFGYSASANYFFGVAAELQATV